MRNPGWRKRKRLMRLLMAFCLLPALIILLFNANNASPRFEANKGVIVAPPLQQSGEPYFLGGTLEVQKNEINPNYLGMDSAQYTLDILLNSRMSGYTYFFTLHTEEAQATWFLLPRPHNSRLWINGIEVLPKERNSITSADAFYLADYGIAPFHCSLQVSGSSMYYGYQGMVFGTFEQISAVQTRWLVLDIFALGLAAMMLVFCFTLYTSKKSETYLLLLALCAFVNTAHFLIVPRYPSMAFFHVGSLAFYRILLCLYYYALKQFIPGIIPKYMDFAVMGVVFLSITFLNYLPRYASTILYNFSFFLWIIQYIFLAKAVLYGVKEAIILLIGNTVALANEVFFLLIDLHLLAHGVIDVLIMPAQYAIMSYTIAFAVATCVKFACKFNEADLLSVDLERRVQEQTRELREANESILSMQAQRQHFISGIVHNLRNPLFALGGYMDLLRDEMEGCLPSQARYLELMNDKITYMAKVSRDLLLISRLEEGTIRFHVVEFDLYELLQAVKVDALSKLKNKHVDISIECGGILLSVDQFALRQVIDNLLDNAVRFSPDGGQIHIRAAERLDEVCISVQDEGPGINKTMMQTLFSKNKGRTLGNTTGLGLSIAHALIEKQGGRIYAENLEKGAKIVFILPLCVKIEDSGQEK